jgi:hypothetical protein
VFAAYDNSTDFDPFCVPRCLSSKRPFMRQISTFVPEVVNDRN